LPGCVQGNIRTIVVEQIEIDADSIRPLHKAEV
jgi:hypothetical protein